MLEVSRQLNPDCEHLLGDMRTLRLERTFDAVFVHDAITYMTTPDDLKQAIETAFVLCKPDGMALFVPDEVSEPVWEMANLPKQALRLPRVPGFYQKLRDFMERSKTVHQATLTFPWEKT